jgi:hypothetical protein
MRIHLLLFPLVLLGGGVAQAESFCQALQREFQAKLQEKISSGVPVVLVSSFFDKKDIKTCEEEIRVKYNLWTEKYDVRTAQKQVSLGGEELQKSFCEFLGCPDSVSKDFKFRMFFNPTTKERLVKLQQQFGFGAKSIFSLSPNLPSYHETLKTALIEIEIRQ